MSFRLTNLTNLQKYIKHKKVVVDDEPKDTDIQEAPLKKREDLLTTDIQTKIDDVTFILYMNIY